MTPIRTYYSDSTITLYHGDALDVSRTLACDVADCIVTSPPYFGKRDYKIDGQYGLEASPVEYVERLRTLFAELRRVLSADGTLWINLGDSYQSSGGKNLLGIPWRVAFALQDDGWILRNAIIWHKTACMPEPVTDRLSNKYEHVFLFSKSRRYRFDLDAIRVPAKDWSVGGPGIGIKTTEHYGAGSGGNEGLSALAQRYKDGTQPQTANPGDVWSMTPTSFPGHFATFPIQLPQRCILAGCRPGGTVLDPFSGSGTTGLATQHTGRRYIGIDINAEYLEMSLTRMSDDVLPLTDPDSRRQP